MTYPSAEVWLIAAYSLFGSLAGGALAWSLILLYEWVQRRVKGASWRR